jgi:hypothetical protein
LIPWVQYQKKLWREDNLSPEREAKLLSIGFSFDESYRGKGIVHIGESQEADVVSNDAWLENLKQFESYYESQMTWLIPSDSEEYKSLKGWINYQRQLFRNNKLSKSKITRLTEMGYSFDLDFRGRKPKLDDHPDWEEKIEELKFYHSKYNTFLIPKELEQYQELKKWLTEQKRLFKNDRLTEEQLDQLNSIGYSFSLNYQGKKFEFEVNLNLREQRTSLNPNKRASWEETYLELVNYRIAEGNCNVPRSHENKTLANFVTRCRFLFKKGDLEQDKIAKLKLLQFEFVAPKTNAWVSKFAELKQFFEIKGHSNYQKSDGNPSIYHWILGQRVSRRKGKLPKDKIAKLDSIKFVWEPLSQGDSPRDDAWFDKLVQLRDYKEKFGHVNVSQLDPQYKSLGRWLNDQRVYKKGRKNSKEEVTFLSKDREAFLEDLGVIWDVKEYEWDLKLNMLKVHYSKYGHFQVTQSDAEFDGLYYWIYNIRKKGTTKAKKEKLVSIGYPSDDIKETDNA